jgi:MoaA/NifB/PqqE/SkfB family radical SAM enzyme
MINYAETLYLNAEKRFYLRKDAKLSFNRRFDHPYIVDPLFSKLIYKVHQGLKVSKILESDKLTHEQKESFEDIITYLIQEDFLTFNKEKSILDVPKSNWVLDEIFFELTKSCNLRCNHCYIDENIIEKEIQSNKWIELLHEAIKHGLSLLKLTGGEALLARGFYDLLDQTRELGIKTRLYSNGMALNQNSIEKLKKHGLNEIQISVDGGTPKTHDDFRNTKGNYEHIFSVIPLILKANIPLTLSYTASTFNFTEIDMFIKQVRQFDGVKVVISPYINYHQTFEGNSKLQLTNDVISQVKLSFQENIDIWSDKTKHYLTYSNKYPGFCGAGLFSIYLDSFGKVLLCPLLNQEENVLGNISKDSLEKIWLESSQHQIYRCVLPVNTVLPAEVVVGLGHTLRPEIFLVATQLVVKCIRRKYD